MTGIDILVPTLRNWLSAEVEESTSGALLDEGKTWSPNFVLAENRRRASFAAKRHVGEGTSPSIQRAVSRAR